MELETRSRPATESKATDDPVLVFEDVHLAFDEKVILKGVSFTVRRGHTKIFLGASGAGKSTILKIVLGLLKPDAGTVHVFGERIDQMSETQLMQVRSKIGMVFQEGALFDSLTVGENVGFKLYEESNQPLDEVRARVEEVLGFVELGDYIDRMPSELSGGQRRRVAIARAMCAKPSLLLYDEPTTGLDPITSFSVDREIIKLRDLHDVTSVLVTHQLRDAFYVATYMAEQQSAEVRLREATDEKMEEADFVMLKDGKIAFEGSAADLRSADDSYLKAFLS